MVSEKYKEGGEYKFVRTVCNGAGKFQMYAVHSIIGNLRNRDVWVAVRRMLPDDDVNSCAGSSIQILKLERTTRRVAAVHKCDNGCKMAARNSFPTHSQSVLSGGKYHLLGRSHGYPPFLG